MRLAQTLVCQLETLVFLNVWITGPAGDPPAEIEFRAGPLQSLFPTGSDPSSNNFNKLFLRILSQFCKRLRFLFRVYCNLTEHPLQQHPECWDLGLLSIIQLRRPLALIYWDVFARDPNETSGRWNSAWLHHANHLDRFPPGPEKTLILEPIQSSKGEF